MKISSFATLLISVLLFGCNQSKVQELEGYVSDLQAELSEEQEKAQEMERKLEKVEEVTKELESSLSDLESVSSDISTIGSMLDDKDDDGFAETKLSGISMQIELEIDAMESHIDNLKEALR